MPPVRWWALLLWLLVMRTQAAVLRSETRDMRRKVDVVEQVAVCRMRQVVAGMQQVVAGMEQA